MWCPTLSSHHEHQHTTDITADKRRRRMGVSLREKAVSRRHRPSAPQDSPAARPPQPRTEPVSFSGHRPYAFTASACFALREAYSGNASANSSTSRRMRDNTFLSVRLCNASEIHLPTCRISGSFMPRVVSAGLPMRMPLGFIGGLVSNGMAFLLTVM